MDGRNGNSLEGPANQVRPAEEPGPEEARLSRCESWHHPEANGGRALAVRVWNPGSGGRGQRRAPGGRKLEAVTRNPGFDAGQLVIEHDVVRADRHHRHARLLRRQWRDLIARG